MFTSVSRRQWSGLLENMRRGLTMLMNFLKASWRISPRNLHKSSFNCWLQLSNFSLRSQLRDRSRWFRSFLYQHNFQFPNVKHRLFHFVTTSNEFSFHVSRSSCLQQLCMCFCNHLEESVCNQLFCFTGISVSDGLISLYLLITSLSVCEHNDQYQFSLIKLKYGRTLKLSGALYLSLDINPINLTSYLFTGCSEQCYCGDWQSWFAGSCLYLLATPINRSRGLHYAHHLFSASLSF